MNVFHVSEKLRASKKGPARAVRFTVAALPVVFVLGCATLTDAASTRDTAERMVESSFSAPQPQLLKRLEQDPAQRICSKIDRAQLTQAEAAEVVKRSRESIK